MKKILGIVMVFVLVLIDQLTKQSAVTKLMNGDYVVIKGILRFHYLENRGVAWGMFAGKVTLFVVITSVMMLAIGYIYFKVPITKRFLFIRLVCISLCAGAIGNLIDRVKNQYVIDFICFDFINFPVFNVADIYVTVSAIAFLILVLFYYKEDEFDFLKLSCKKNDK